MTSTANQADIAALAAMFKQTFGVDMPLPVASTPVATPAPAPETPVAAPVAKRTRKPKVAPIAPVASTPVTVAAPVATVAMKVDGTEVYKAMVAFTHKAITVLRKADGNKSKGIHSVFSGFNAAFGEHFSLAKEQVWSCVDAMAERGHIGKRFAKGGVMLYLPGEMPQTERKATSDVLALILGTK